MLTPTADNSANQHHQHQQQQHVTNAQTITPSAKHTVNTYKTRYNRTKAHKAKLTLPDTEKRLQRIITRVHHIIADNSARIAQHNTSNTSRKADQHKPTANRTNSTRTPQSTSGIVSIYIHTIAHARQANTRQHKRIISREKCAILTRTR